jgi:hypothetical protein
MKDTVDGVPVGLAVNDIVFDHDNNERRSWIFFGRKVARSQAVFIFQVLIVATTVTVSLVNLTLEGSCESKSFWIALLSSSIGWILPSPSLM